MAPLVKSFALAGALCAALTSAAPLQKRDNVVVWQTSTTVEWTTVDVTTTVYPTPEPTGPTTHVISVIEATPTAQPQPVQSQQPAPQPQTSQAPAPAPAPAPESSSSSSTSSTVAPVEPTATAAPEPTTTAAPVQQPTTQQQQQQPTTTQQAPPATSSSSSSGSGSGSGYTGSCSKDSPCKGQITYYDTATSASAPSSCGWTNDGESENVLALPHGIMTDADCGRMVTVSYGGLKKTGKVVDKCMGCDNTSIDLSKHFFSELAEMALGRLFGVEWYIE